LFVMEVAPAPSEHRLAASLRAKLRQPKLEHYWLCDDCATHWTLISHQMQGVEMSPLRKPMGTVRALDGIRSGLAKARPQLVPSGA
jgi:hypothetical protein